MAGGGEPELRHVRDTEGVIKPELPSILRLLMGRATPRQTE
eukprot:COSAG05_NODE_14128_length_407_cov_0.607143_1_plen_40_part_01